MIRAENTTAIGMIVIIPPTITEGGMNKEGSMQTGKDIRITGAIIGGEISEETSIRSRLEIINESWIETRLVPNQSNEE